jgi:hypothetical protein
MALVTSGLLVGTTFDAQAKEEAGLKAQAKITQADAEKTALAKVPGGKVKEAELEEEDGLLVWCIDITGPDTKDETEVLVDAKTGKVVSVSKETPGEEKKEQAKEEEDDKKGEHDEDNDKD